MATYSESIKEQMVRRLLSPPGISVMKLAEETGISTSALWKWKRAREMSSEKLGEFTRAGVA